MSGTTPPKRLKTIVECAEKQGWTYDETKDGHPRLNPPRGLMYGGKLAPPVVFGKTPSDRRGDANTVALLRRLGVDIPRK